MAEQIYTIPVNDAFDSGCECPMCQMQKDLERNAIEYTMGPSYMEDDNRAMTDKLGFCSHHLRMLYQEKNRLGLALMMNTHMNKTIQDMRALAIVRNIILMHHGTIKVHSEENIGTTFTMRIPLNYVENQQ